MIKRTPTKANWEGDFFRLIGPAHRLEFIIVRTSQRQELEGTGPMTSTTRGTEQ